MQYPDIYFHPGYASAHESVERGSAAQFIHRSALGTVSHTFIVRPIDAFDEGMQGYCDIVSPYGYGGPIVLEGQGDHRQLLLDEFIAAFSKYVAENRIVSEFIRFHPIEQNHAGLDHYYDISSIKKTLATNLVDFGDPFQAEFSKQCRKRIEKCQSMGMKFSMTTSADALREFIDIYISTMDRNSALEYYYFDEGYFIKLMELFPQNIFIATVEYDNRKIAAGMFMCFGRYVHAHLSGTMAEYIKLSPAYLLRAGVVQWSREQGFKFMHHGGGYTNSEEDGLFKFKKSFAQLTEFDFYVGKRIWNAAVYSQLTQHLHFETNGSSAYFPAYRRRS